jgi:hypothetical protein
MRDNSGELVSLDSRPVRDVGNCIGQSFDMKALRELGIVDDDGELVDDELTARQKIHSDGRIVIDLPLDEIDAIESPATADD